MSRGQFVTGVGSCAYPRLSQCVPLLTTLVDDRRLGSLALSPPKSSFPAPLLEMSNSFSGGTGRGMFYSGTLVCPALLSQRAGTWPLMQNRLMYSRGMARRDLLILEIELGKEGSGEEAVAVRVDTEESEPSSGVWALRFLRGPCRKAWVRRRKKSGRQVIGSSRVEDE